MHFLLSPFLWIGIITLVCHCFGACPVLHATLQTRVSQRTPYVFIAFNISGLISSSPGAVPVFIDLITAFTSVRLSEYLPQPVPREFVSVLHQLGLKDH